MPQPALAVPVSVGVGLFLHVHEKINSLFSRFISGAHFVGPVDVASRPSTAFTKRSP